MKHISNFKLVLSTSVVAFTFAFVISRLVLAQQTNSIVPLTVTMKIERYDDANVIYARERGVPNPKVEILTTAIRSDGSEASLTQLVDKPGAGGGWFTDVQTQQRISLDALTQSRTTYKWPLAVGRRLRGESLPPAGYQRPPYSARSRATKLSTRPRTLPQDLNNSTLVSGSLRNSIAYLSSGARP